MSENVTSLVVPEGDGGGGGGGRSLPNLIRHLGEFIRCALHRNGSPRPHPQPLPRAVYIGEKRKPSPRHAAPARLRPTAEEKLKLFTHERT